MSKVGVAAFESLAPKRLLLREYIQKSLYDPQHGYFSNSTTPVLRHKSIPRFHDIPNRAAYQNLVANTYASVRHGWMTPVELFSPFLSRAIANRIQSVAQQGEKLNIIEIGAGRGTLASDVLSYWAQSCPESLSRLRYHVVEISPALSALQGQRLKRWVDSGLALIHHADAISWFDGLRNASNLRDIAAEPCHVIGTEVLDNMPHDLIRITLDGIEQAELSLRYRNGLHVPVVADLMWSSEIDHETKEAMEMFGIGSGESASVSPGRIRSFTDSLKTIFEAILGGGTREVWVPTASFHMLRSLTMAIPHAHITLGDFDSFPGALPAQNGPVIQNVERGSAIVYDSVQTAPFGNVDIMFPTNFTSLIRGHKALTASHYPNLSHVRQIMSQQQFFDEYALEQDIQSSTCRDGYNPILQDFENASFLLVNGHLHDKC